MEWHNVHCVADLNHSACHTPLRIVTEHPLTVARWIQLLPAYRHRYNVPPSIITPWHVGISESPVQIILSKGKTEPKAILYDQCIVDIVEQGLTMEANGLKRIGVLDSYITARFIANRSLIAHPDKWMRVIGIAHQLAGRSEADDSGLHAVGVGLGGQTSGHIC